MSEKVVRLEDIARRAGVSRNTVSVALRNKPGVSDKLRAEIRRLADEMGYRPNPLVSALMHDLRAARPSAAATNIAFLHYFGGRNVWKHRHYCAEMFKGIESQCSHTGYNAVTVWGPNPA